MCWRRSSASAASGSPCELGALHRDALRDRVAGDRDHREQRARVVGELADAEREHLVERDRAHRSAHRAST